MSRNSAVSSHLNQGPKKLAGAGFVGDGLHDSLWVVWHIGFIWTVSSKNPRCQFLQLFSLFLMLLIYLLLAVLGLCCCWALLWLWQAGSYSLVVVLGLFIAAAPPAAEHRL